MQLSAISLALTRPSKMRYAQGDALQLNFTNSERLDPRINFSRTTNATVTNSVGLITYAPMNLLTYSEQFDNSYWTKADITVTANAAVAPNGTTTADLLSPTTADAYLRQLSLSFTAGQTYTASIYLKSNSSNTFNINFRLRESAGLQESIKSITITPEWQRYDVTLTANTTGTYVLWVGGNGSWGSGENLLIWGAQLEIGSTATTYNSTTVKNLLGYSELFDNAAWTKSNSFVQTNLLTYSEAFDNAAWTKELSAITADSIIAPNGYQTADTLTGLSIGNAGVYESKSVSASTTYTWSVYAKAGTVNWIAIGTFDGTTDVRQYFNILTGVVGSAENGTMLSASITPVGNGWYRCSCSRTMPVGATSARCQFSLASADLTRTGTGAIYIWGAQLVQGSVAGDYRRTDAAALPVYYPNHNGVVCAEKLVETTAVGGHLIRQTYAGFISGTTYVFSAYVKKSERSVVVLDIPNAPFPSSSIWFNLDTGLVSKTSGTTITANLVDAGNGWYRIYAIATADATVSGSWDLYLDNSPTGTTSYTGDGTSGIYIFGAQLSDSASLDPYVLNAAASPTAAAYYGARFDYDPVTLAPKGLLIEEQRANLLLNSAIAGTNLATQNVTVTAVAHTLTFYGTGNIVLSGTASATLTGAGAYPTRSTLTFTPTAGTLTLTVTGTVQYAQLEIGAFATSFIPTAASQVTRAADVATIQGSNFYSWYNQNEGSVFVNSKADSLSGFKGIWSISADGGNIIDLRSQINGDAYRGLINYNSIEQSAFEFANTYSATQFVKTVIAYKQNNSAGVTSGLTVTTDTLCTIPIANKLSLGDVATFKLNGTIKQISYYPQRLSDSVLKGLTA